MMIVFYSLIALFISWIWVDYYRLIDIYEKDKLKYFIFSFVGGCLSVIIVYGFEYLLQGFRFSINGDFINDLLFCIFKIGLIEEIAKATPFFVFFVLFRKQINEPIDLIAFICTSALGFSAVENVLYFSQSGAGIIYTRSILCSIGHMIDTAIFGYGLVKYIYEPGKRKIYIPIVYLLVAATTHGIYDFLLMFEPINEIGFLIAILYFLGLISVFAEIMNNSLNNSPFFTYKKVVDSSKVAMRLLSYYGIIIVLQLVADSIINGFEIALGGVMALLWISGIIIIIICVRLSQFTLIQSKWKRVKLELPFTFGAGGPHPIYGNMITMRIFSLKVKGQSYNEVYLSCYYQEYFTLKPVNKKKTFIRSPRKAYIKEKIFLKNDLAIYHTHIYNDNDEFEEYVLFPKIKGQKMIQEQFPIMGLFKVKNGEQIHEKMKHDQLKFVEWCYPKTIEEI